MEDNMRKSLLEIYALAVCFILVACFVVAMGVAVYEVVKIAKPEFTLSSYEYKRHQNNDEFWRSYKMGYENRDKDVQRPSEDILTKQRLESYPLTITAERRDAFQSLTISTIILIINLIVYLVHWQIARRARGASLPA
jgi:hypothetical protein